MAKTNKKTTEEVKEPVVAQATEQVEKQSKISKVQKPTKTAKEQKNVKADKKVKATKEPKKSKVKETFGELKKVSWPTFGKTMKQLGTVLAVVAIFGVVVLGFDLLVSEIIKLVSKL